jgi:hypothetical protein
MYELCWLLTDYTMLYPISQKLQTSVQIKFAECLLMFGSESVKLSPHIQKRFVLPVYDTVQFRTLLPVFLRSRKSRLRS